MVQYKKNQYKKVDTVMFLTFCFRRCLISQRRCFVIFFYFVIVSCVYGYATLKSIFLKCFFNGYIRNVYSFRSLSVIQELRSTCFSLNVQVAMGPNTAKVEALQGG